MLQGKLAIVLARVERVSLALFLSLRSDRHNGCTVLEIGSTLR
jgi:hypothetical protein